MKSKETSPETSAQEVLAAPIDETKADNGMEEAAIYETVNGLTDYIESKEAGNIEFKGVVDFGKVHVRVIQTIYDPHYRRPKKFVLNGATPQSLEESISQTERIRREGVKDGEKQVERGTNHIEQTIQSLEQQLVAVEEQLRTERLALARRNEDFDKQILTKKMILSDITPIYNKKNDEYKEKLKETEEHLRRNLKK